MNDTRRCRRRPQLVLYQNVDPSSLQPSAGILLTFYYSYVDSFLRTAAAASVTFKQIPEQLER